MIQDFAYTVYRNILPLLGADPDDYNISWVLFKIVLKINTFYIYYLCWRHWRKLSPNQQGSWTTIFGGRNRTTPAAVKKNDDDNECSDCCASREGQKDNKKNHKKSGKRRECDCSLKKVLKDAGIDNIDDEMISAAHRIGKTGADQGSKKGGGSKPKRRSPEPGVQGQHPVTLGDQAGEAPGSLRRRSPLKLMEADNFQAHKNSADNDFQNGKQ